MDRNIDKVTEQPEGVKKINHLSNWLDEVDTKLDDMESNPSLITSDIDIPIPVTPRKDILKYLKYCFSMYRGQNSKSDLHLCIMSLRTIHRMSHKKIARYLTKTLCHTITEREVQKEELAGVQNVQHCIEKVQGSHLPVIGSKPALGQIIH